VELVFSICRIRQFTETTECLQDEIIVFVNKIVKIIHECTRRWDGKPTKNFGERYLLTWRVPSYADAVDMVKAENADTNINLDQTVKQMKNTPAPPS
jgi:class 3 adenylate cyclase